MDKLKPKRIEPRIYVLWGCALGLLTILGLGGLLFSFVLVPALKAKDVIDDPLMLYTHAKSRKVAVRKLGGPKNAANAIGKYLLLRLGSSFDQETAVSFLAHCEGHGVPLLVDLVEKRGDLKKKSLCVLEEVGPEASPAVKVLGKILDDSKETQEDKLRSIGVLRSIGQPASSEAPKLCRIAASKGEYLQPAAMYALSKVLPADEAGKILLSTMRKRIGASPIKVDETYKFWRYALRDLGTGAQTQLEMALASTDSIERFLGLMGLNAISPEYRVSTMDAVASVIRGPDHAIMCEGSAAEGLSLRRVARDTLMTVATNYGRVAIGKLGELASDRNADVSSTALRAIQTIEDAERRQRR